ncbi:1-(5-phosphoribosyl)-5-[(5-phosphoribosylamino)methylideneamino]imidazole-4-carboxamide isomerase [Hyphococcus sp.]|jgi:phosphoribosylformimino-5-aminoimidazole carboxamide ribotide isomerase|uniref:1-(5-phosphoribosyl)-5-[(5- phosphoribosylamino)methylideneamino]imidazole-4- carboxamide isomerase n=1 Tax=Hyphococcus sp. TaxID=2038636 RepID=UPI003D13B540
MTRSLTLYPAIDLKGGECVRLLHGRMEASTVYNSDPASQAAAFEAAGFNWVHIVDLDGAFAGAAVNGEAVDAILKRVSLKAQLGGGVRNMAAVERWLEAGMTRVILGTAAVNDPDFVAEACKRYPGRIVLGVDARDGRVKTDGWDGDTETSPAELVKRYADQGVAAVVYTDISRDGALAGVNVEATADLADMSAIPVIASGGVASLEDVTALKAAHANIEGVIIGRALYDGRIDPGEALAAAR